MKDCNRHTYRVLKDLSRGKIQLIYYVSDSVLPYCHVSLCMCCQWMYMCMYTRVCNSDLARLRYIWLMEYYNTSVNQISVYIHGSTQVISSGVLELTHFSPRELNVGITSQFHLYTGTLKLATMQGFTPWKKKIPQIRSSPVLLPNPLACWLLNICQHITGFKSSFGK